MNRKKKKLTKIIEMVKGEKLKREEKKRGEKSEKRHENYKE